MRRMTVFLLTVLCAVAGRAAEPVFDVRFDTRPGSKLPAPWKNYGSGTPMQIHDGNLVFTNTDPQWESGIVCRLELEKGFDYEFTVELAEAVPGKKVEGVVLQLSSAEDRNIRVLTKAPAGSGDLGQYVSSSMRYLVVTSGKAAFYLRSQKGSTPRAKIRRVRAVRSADLRQWLPANQPPFHVYGLPFMKENNGAYYRYPEARASGLSTWNASCAPSGARIRFKTNADKIELRINHGLAIDGLSSMSSLSMAGIDIYQGPPDHMVFAWRPGRELDTGPSHVGVYVPKGPAGSMREYTLYLPMYSKLAGLDIALSPVGAQVLPPTPYRLAKPVVWYSTSFAQGAGSSGPSMSFPALTCRLLGVDLANYGLSGNREWREEEAEILAEIDAAIYVMGPLLGDAPRMKERYPKMVATLRRRRPRVPILLVTRLHTLGAAEPHEVNSLVRELYEKRRAAGDQNIHFLDVFPLYSDGTIPYTIDGVHVTDLGAKVIADAFVPVIRRILGLP